MPFLLKIILYGSANVGSRYIEHVSPRSTHSFWWYCNLLFVRQTWIHHQISFDEWRSIQLQWKQTNVHSIAWLYWQKLYRLLLFHYPFSTNVFWIVVTLDKLLYFINGYVSLNMLASSFNKIIRGLQAIYCLKSYCRLPRIALSRFVARLAGCIRRIHSLDYSQLKYFWYYWKLLIYRWFSP